MTKVRDKVLWRDDRVNFHRSKDDIDETKDVKLRFPL